MKELKIKPDVSFRDLTTFKVGGKAKYYCELENKEDLLEALKFAEEEALPIFILGGGSDILVNDKGFSGLVISYKGKNLSFEEDGNVVRVTAGAGMVWDDLVKESVTRGLQGIECLSGIPGSVGAAPIQNIGAYGQELKDTFANLEAYDTKEKKFVKFDKDACGFSYRDSVFKSKSYWQRFIITDLTLKLKKNSQPKISYESLTNYLRDRNISNPSVSEIRDAVLEIRKSKFESYKVFPNAGSFFKNPLIKNLKFKILLKKYPEMPYFENGNGKYKCFAGWFIEKAGWKGSKLGNAQVSSKHALILLNPNGNAKASEIRKLAEKISSDVYKKFGVKLEPEVQFIGFS